jgi:beta-galactosidase
VAIGLLALPTVLPAADRARIIQPFDTGWMFRPGDAPGAEQPMFDDASWRPVDVPHDWSIEGVPVQDAAVERGGGYRPSGVSWYRKRFSLPAGFALRRVFVEFDGVMANSEVWINGNRLGRRPSGYVSFVYELTGFVKVGDGQSNLLAVKTDTTVQPASRWYTGQGIYRHVRLVVTAPARIEPWGLSVSTPTVETDRALVRAHARVTNGGESSRDLTVRITLLDPDGHAAGTSETLARPVRVGETVGFTQDISVAKPQRWDIAQGRLYRAVAQVWADGVLLDDELVAFGIRDTRFEPATGFWLNGRNVKIKGVCLHHDGGAVGAAVPIRVWERRLERLRTLGVNAIRTAHNPPAPDFLDLCDRMGMLVMDELFDAWTVGKPHAERGYNVHFTEWWEADARDTIRRDRNHPSVILYSTGNEIHDTPEPALAKSILAKIIGVIREQDPTRPITQALFRPNVSHDFDNGLADMLDVIGVNYRDDELVAAQRAKPGRRIIGTEQRHELATWLVARDNPQHAGQFLWTGVDYLGEADWPFVANSAGLLDRTDVPKPRAYQRQSWWSDQPTVHIARNEPGLADSDPRRDPGFDRTCDWTPRDPATYKEASVEVYSNCEEVELVLNGRSLGAKPLPADASPREWTTPFEPGTIRAIGRISGKIVASDELRTAGVPARLVVETDRDTIASHWDDIAHVTVTVVDEHGILCPWADDLVTFTLDGPGTLVAVDNGDRTSHDAFQTVRCRVFQGRCLAIVRANASSGRITLKASAPGLAGAAVTIGATPGPR